MLLSTQQEIAMGREADPDIVQFFGLYESPQLQRFIDQKGQEMVKISHRNELEYEFKIVDSPVINAFAVPGGYVYFTRGIMAHFNNEAEFAGVLGHEIGHIAARHSAKQYSKAMAAQLGLAVGSIASEKFRQFADVAQTGVGLLFLKFGRDAERQSDKLGVEYSTKIGYDAHEMAGFFNTLQRKQEQSGQESIPDFLSTHPNPQDRFKTVNQLATQWQKKLNITNPAENRDSYLRMIDGIVYGEDPRQGYVENNVFYHPVMKFQYPIPRGWNIQNTPQQVQMAPDNGEALMMLTLSGERTLEAAAEAVLKNYQLSLVESNKVNVNGFPAIVMVADQQQDQTIRTLTYVIEDDDRIYNFIGVTLLNNFSSYSSTFRATMGEFSRLTDRSKIDVEPARIRIKTVNQTGTLEDALKQLGAGNNQMNELAVLNGMELNDRVTQGMLIKVIEK
ncbi:Putative Zn-dependent protease [Fulvivirga imtechensis AK7]|uniref:Putative Zn-dependent protease n=2 Tax=Fulvivirga TaxID=396811 RepID=L8JSX6_9BACT|nr:Putative Zn-dependent protease [Fulvivirga imtechensis AK7]